MENRERPYPHYKFPDEIEIEIQELTDEQCEWYSLKLGSYLLTTKNYGWFPTGVLMETDKSSRLGKYVDTKNLGVGITGNLGTMNVGVVSLTKSISLLKKAGYVIYNDLYPLPKRKYKKGDIVLHDGIIGRVYGMTSYDDNTAGYYLESVADTSLTTTAQENELEEVPEEYDDNDAVRSAQGDAAMLMFQVDRLTDKYMGDGSFGGY